MKRVGVELNGYGSLYNHVPIVGLKDIKKKFFFLSISLSFKIFSRDVFINLFCFVFLPESMEIVSFNQKN